MKQITKFNFSKLFTLAVFVLVLFESGQQAFSEDGVIWTRNVWPLRLLNAVFSPDDQFIYATGCYNDDNKAPYSVFKYDLQGNLLDTIDTIGGIRQFSEDGQFFWNYNGDKYDANTFKKLFSFGGGGYNMNWAPWNYIIDSKHDIGIAAAGGKIIDSWPDMRRFYDSSLIIFKPSDMSILRWTSYPFPGRVFMFVSADLNPNGEEAAFLIKSTAIDYKGHFYTDTARIEIWNIQTLKKVRAISITMPNNFDNSIKLKYSPDGSVLGYQHDGKLTLYSTTDYSVVWESTGILSYLFSWTNDMKYLYCSQMEFGLNKYNYNTKSMIYHFNLPSYSEFINFDSKNNYCLCSWGDGELILLDNNIVSVADPFFTTQYQTSLIENQTNSNPILLITAPAPNIATYTITNTLGKTYTKPTTLNLNQGQNSFDINTDALQSGTYFLNLTIADHTTTLKFIVVR